MLILCPTCRHAIRVRDLRPGRFTPRCPRCERTFQLTIPDQPGQTPIVTAIEPSLFAEPVFSDAEPIVLAEVPSIAWPVTEPGRDDASRWPAWLPRGTPRLLGEHLLLRLLGHGPRGRAFLAQPLNLGPREVIKQVAADRAGDPVYVAHHLREAFAAAQLADHQLVRLRSLGAARGHLFSVVEHVDGPSLAELRHEQATLDPYQATVIVLQAARGLRAAHAQGLWHKDVKPENIRLSREGRARVDDLGLEMTPSLAAAIEARERPAEPARGPEKAAPPPALVGTPAFMAPEQARDPLAIDGRADIYALGATYYTVIAGRPPFQCDNAVELIRKHQEETPVPAAEYAKGLPRPIGDAIRTMMGKHPEERYPNIGVVVDVLEQILDLRGEPATAMLADAEATVRAAAETLDRSSARQVRSRILALCGLIALACCTLLFLLGLPWPALGLLAFNALTATAIALTSGVLHRSDWLRCSLATALGSVRAWVVALAITGGVLAALVLWGGFLAWFLIVCAGGLAAAFHITLDRPWAAIRSGAIASARDCVRQLRARGFDEPTVRGLVARCRGSQAGALLDALFGPGSLADPALRGTLASARPGPFARLAEWLRTGMERRLQQRLDRRHQTLLEQAEAGRLEAGGLNLLTARRRARRMAKAMMLATHEWRDEQRLLAGGPASPSMAPAGPPLLERLARAARQPEPVLEPHEPRRNGLLRRIDAFAGFALGRGLRFLLAMLLLGLLAFWLDQKGILTAAQVRAQAVDVFEVGRRAAREADPGILRELTWSLSPDWRRLREPLDLPILADVLGATLPAANLAAAGLILLASTLSRRRIAGFFGLLGAAAALLGPRLGLSLPVLLPRLDAPAQAMIAGVTLLAIGLLWPRRKAAGP